MLTEMLGGAAPDEGATLPVATVLLAVTELELTFKDDIDEVNWPMSTVIGEEGLECVVVLKDGT